MLNSLKYLTNKIMKRNNVLKIMVLALIGIIVSGCADVENVSNCLTNYTYGFWFGVWHGFISPFSLIGSFISNDIAVYAVNNTGKLYDLGFVWGCGLFYTVFKIRSSKRK